MCANLVNMNNLNVFKYSRRPRYYLLHPWKFIKETCQNLRAAWHRAIFGYAYRDIWELGPQLLEILPPMLRHLEKYHCGTPCDMTDEEWTQWLHNMADSIERLQEENWEKQNEYADEFFRESENMRREERLENEGLRITWSNEPNYEVLTKKYFARRKELNEQWYVEAEKVGAAFFKAIQKLWD